MSEIAPRPACDGKTPLSDGISSCPADPAVLSFPTIDDPWSVDKVLATIPGGRPAEKSSSPVPYFHLVEMLKTRKREGWRRFGIEHGESIADHMYRMAMMTLAAPPSITQELDMDRCVKMCLVHDMAESLVGDITPVDGISKPEKSRREATTMDYITKRLLGNVGDGMAGQHVRALWQEYEDSRTAESIYVHDLDKMELLLQMIEYEKRADRRLDLGEFAYVTNKIVRAEVKEWAGEVLKERAEFWDGRDVTHGEAGIAGGVNPDKKKMSDAYYAREG